jgi:osmoprotectant transport system ATP-binding protein
MRLAKPLSNVYIQAMLELQEISKSYGDKKVLDRVSLSVPEGVTHALIGSSGSGKTTLLRIMLGLIDFEKGYVKINDQPLLSHTPAAWAEKIGYVPQDGGLFPHLNTRRNITLVAELRGWSSTRIEARLKELSSVVELDPLLLDQFPVELSGGQQQRVALMRATFMDPPVMLLDEPMGALDPLIRRSLQEELKSVFARLKKTVILVTHDLSEAVFLATQMSLLHEGRIVQTGSYEDFIRRPADAFVTYFIQAQRGLPEIGEVK